MEMNDTYVDASPNSLSRGEERGGINVGKKSNSGNMKKKYIAPKIEIIKVENGCNLLAGSDGNASYVVGDPTTKPSGDVNSGGISAGGDDIEFVGQGAKKYNGWTNWSD